MFLFLISSMACFLFPPKLFMSCVGHKKSKKGAPVADPTPTVFSKDLPVEASPSAEKHNLVSELVLGSAADSKRFKSASPPRTFKKVYFAVNVNLARSTVTLELFM